MPRLLAYQRQWEVVPPAVMSLLLIAAAHGYKPKVASKRTLRPTSPEKVTDRASELRSLAALFPNGRLR